MQSAKPSSDQSLPPEQLPADLEAAIEDAAALPPIERERALAELLAANPERRAAIDARLTGLRAIWQASQTPGLGDFLVPKFRQLGPYELGNMLGHGGMGVVYAGFWPEMNRRDAVKLVLAGGKSADELLARFRHEVQIHDRLQHEGIAKLRQVGFVEAQGRKLPWFSMELIEGAKPLDRHADDAGLDTSARLRLFLQVVDAVAYAHARHVLHRDLKPSNALVDRHGTVKLIDFGIARDLVSDAPLTRTGVVHGTPDYMAPEVRRGQRQLDARCDVYSLGVMLAELLGAGRPHGTVAAAIAALHDRLRRSDPAFASGIAAVARACLAERPGDRYADALALAADVRRVLAGQAPRPPRLRRIGRWLAAGALAAALGVALVPLWGLAAPDAAVAHAKPAAPAPTLAEARAALAAGNFAEALRMAQAAHAPGSSWAGDLVAGEAARHLDSWVVSEQAPPARKIAVPLGRSWFLSAGETTGVAVVEFASGRVVVPPRSLHEPAAPSELLTISARGDRVAAASARGEVCAWQIDAASGQLGQRLWRIEPVGGADGRVGALAMSRDGELVALARANGDVTIVRGGDGVPLATCNDARRANDLAFAADSGALAIASAPGWLTVRQRADASGTAWPIAAQVAAGEPHAYGTHQPLRGVAALDAGRWITAGHRGHAAVFELSDASLRRQTGLSDVAGDVSAIAVAPSRRLLAVGGTEATCRVFATSGTLLATLPVPGGELRQIEFLDDTLLAVLGGDGRVRLWSPPVADVSRKWHLATVRGLALSPDGTRLASVGSDETLRIAALPQLQLQSTWRGHRNQPLCVAWTRDGRELITGAADHTAVVWDAQTGAARLRLEGHSHDVSAVCVDATDRRILTASRDGTVRSWLRSDGRGEVLARVPGEIVSMAHDADSGLLVVGTRQGQVAILDAASGTLVRSHTHGAVVGSLAMLGRERVVFGAHDGRIAVLDVRGDAPPRVLCTQGSRVWALVVHPRGEELLSGHESGEVQVWALVMPADAKPRATWRAPGNKDSVMALAVSSGGGRWFVGMTGGALFAVEPLADRPARLGQAIETRRTKLAAVAVDALRWRAATCADLVRVAAADRTLDTDLRAHVVAALQAEGDDPDRLATEAMDMLHAAAPTHEQLEIALAKLRYARAHITQERGYGLEAVEAALLYRLGDKVAALALLDQLTEHPKMLGLAHVLIPAVRALCQQAHGATAPARAECDRLRALVDTDRWRDKPRAKAWLAEVEAALSVAPPPGATRTPGERPR